MIALAGLSLAADLAIPFPRDHDRFATPGVLAGAGPSFVVTEVSTPTLPVDLGWSPSDQPDGAKLGRLRVPVGRPGATLYLLTAMQGSLDAKGVAATGLVRFADGASQPLKWLVGEQAWPAWAGATGRLADPVAVGRNAAGDLLTASLLTVSLTSAIAVEAIEIEARPGIDMALLAAAISDDAPRTGHAPAEAQAPGFDFRVPLGGGPGGRAVSLARGPVTQRVLARDGHLWTEDGARWKGWGIDLVREGAVPPLESAEEFARAFAAMGFDVARPHHLDVDGVLLDPARGTEGRGPVLAEALDRYDRFHAARAAAGMYTILEMSTLRAFRAGEGVPGFAEVPNGHKYVGYAWPEWRRAQREWFAALYDRVNPYTGRRYADDPAVAMVELNNENSLLVGWSGGALEKLGRTHRDRFDRLWNGWLLRKYGDDRALGAAWAGAGRAGLQVGEALTLQSVAREPTSRGRTELFPGRRTADLLAFYAELERDYVRELTEFVRGLGFRAPLVCNTSMGVPAADALLGLCDVVDLHLYWDPIAETTAFNNTALLDGPGRWIEKLAACQDGLPCTISELNHSWPNRYGAEAPLTWATLAARQDVDAVLWFAWSHAAIDPAAQGPTGSNDLQGRWNVLAQMHVARRLFRDLAVAAAQHTRWWSPMGIVRDLAEGSTPWLDEQVSLPSFLSRRVRSSFAPLPPILSPGPPSREIAPARWVPGTLAIETPAIEAIVGRAGLETRLLRVEREGAAAVSLASVDGRPLAEARDAWLTAVGSAAPVGTAWPEGGLGARVVGTGPTRLERLSGEVVLRVGRRPTVTRIGADGTERGVVRLRRARDGWALPLDAETAWWRARW